VLNGTYRILRPLAEGGCGEVYVAAHTRLPGEFAVKVLRLAMTADADALSRFRCEAEITSSMRHPHVVQVFDFNVTDAGLPYLVMELLEGQPLAKRVAAGGPLEPDTAVHIVEQIASALHAAHQRGIVHRDLKPDNVILLSVDGRDDFVKLVDFGISQASGRPRLTGDAHVVGTPQFMAPEQARGVREGIDARTDQFSLAAIAYTLLTGTEPFWGDDLTAVLYQVVYESPVRPSQRAPWLGAAVDAVLARGLAKASAERYSDILAFAAALRAAVGASGCPAVVPARPRAVGARAVGASTMDAATVQFTRDLRPASRRSAHGRHAALAMAAVALGAGLWVCAPWTGGHARAAWGRTRGDVARVIDHAVRAGTAVVGTFGSLAASAASSGDQEPSRSGAVSMP